jgi:hypothetical protein
VEENPRQAVRVRLDEAVAPQSARLLLDGADVTAYAQWRGNELVFAPQEGLFPGNHQAQFYAQEPSGRPLQKEWNFTVTPGHHHATDVTVTNLRPGNYVPPVFEVEGQTEPYATVSVSILSNQPWSTSARADAAGHFDVPMDMSWRARNTPGPLTLQIQATMGDGRTGPAQTLPLVLR